MNDDSLDMATLQELKELLEEGVNELLEEYLADTPLQLQRMRDAISAQDRAAITIIAHTLKGSSGNLGVSRLYHLCAEMEQASKDGRLDDPQASLQVIEAEFQRAQLELNRFMAQ